MKLNAIVPLLLFISLILVLLLSLTIKNNTSPSDLIGQQANEQTGALLHGQDTFSATQMRGERWLLNVWASWCQACKQEHKFLLQLASKLDEPLIGLNYKDTPEEATLWLTQHQNPYAKIIVDIEGSYGIGWEVAVVPETFLIDENGIIQHRHVGSLTPVIIDDIVLPFFNNGHE
jgi:cytochrome c biogenesis protein CcmG/thiol:disulfide interchange protein DsbE